jgi:putative membrane protein
MESPSTIISPGQLFGAWPWEPSVLAPLVVFVWLYVRGARKRAVPRARSAAFSISVLIVAIALLSPLHALAGTLFSAHMTQHMLLVVGAAPLVSYARPGACLLRGMPAAARPFVRKGGAMIRPARRVLAYPLAAGALHAVVLWLWHLPGPYEAAVENQVVHAIEHASLFGSALVVWTAVVHHSRSRRRGPALALLLLFGTALQSGALGAILTFAETALYPVHAGGPRMWGISPLADQQLAGAIMWIPAGAVYFATMAAVFFSWMKRMDAAGSLERIRA